MLEANVPLASWLSARLARFAEHSDRQFRGMTMATLDAPPEDEFSVHRIDQGFRWPVSAVWRPGEPIVRKIDFADLKDAITKGLEDFKAIPSHALFIGILYPLLGLVLCRVLFGYDILPLVFPLIAGFALIGPLAAIGLYELSRRRELGLDTSALHAFDVLRSPSIGAITRVGILLAAIFFAWIGTAQLMAKQILGSQTSSSVEAFARDVLTTDAGRELILVGNGVGFVFAVVAMVVSVVSLPMLVDRKVGAGTAIRTSIRAVLENPVMMALWGLFVAIALLLGAIPLLLGLAIVLPVLGHATWHLYRKVVSSDEVI